MSDDRPVVVAGATGFVGRHLLAYLADAGVPLRGGTRRPDLAAARHPRFDWVALDLDDPGTLDMALSGARAVVHLVHHMNDPRGDLVARETAAAKTLVAAAERAGVERIVYLGAPVPKGASSSHIRAREATGRVLHDSAIPCFELRASMIVGVGSESWLIVRDLAMRLPAMVLPNWLRSRTQPIWIGDVVAAIARCLALPTADAGVWDLPGPEVMTAKEIVMRTAAADGRRPPSIGVPVLTPALSSTWIRLVTRADMDIARKLVDGLTTDLVVEDDGLYARCPDLPRTPFDEAARRALEEEPEVAGVASRAWEHLARRLTPRRS